VPLYGARRSPEAWTNTPTSLGTLASAKWWLGHMTFLRQKEIAPERLIFLSTAIFTIRRNVSAVIFTLLPLM
jgi:hypothetical protein